MSLRAYPEQTCLWTANTQIAHVAESHIGRVMNSRFHRQLRITASIVILTCAISAAGCRSLANNGWIAPPGPMNYQQANAIVHDPFLQADIGHDDNTMRPPDYRNPLAMPVRNQMKNQVAPWLAP